MFNDLALILLLVFFQILYFLNSVLILKKSSTLKINENPLIKTRKLLSILVFTISFGELFYLIQIFLKKDTRYVIVNVLVTDDLSDEYRMFASWSNTSGTLLLWFCFLSLVQIIIEFIFENIERHNNTVTIVSGFVLLNLIGLVFENPFVKESIPSQNWGLAPSLQSPYIGIHPFLSFLAYALSIIPFAIYATQTTVHDELLKKIESISIIVSFLLGTVIITGAIWAYEVLWGGHWTWDLIENLSLLIFLCSILPYHMKKQSKDIQLLSHAFTFPAVLFSTFIIRSGLIQSIHGYAFSSSAVFFLIIFLVSLYPFRRIKINSYYNVDFSFSDFGNSIWLISLISIILTILISTITIGFYAVVTSNVLKPPILLFHYGIITLLILPLLITLTLELRYLFNFSFRSIKLFWYLISVLYLLLINYPIMYTQKYNPRGMFFGILPLSVIFLSSIMNNTQKRFKMSYRHFIRFSVHMLFLLFIFSLLLSHYSQTTRNSILTESTENEIFGRNLNMIDYKFSSSITDDNKAITLPNNVDWDLRVNLLIDGEKALIFAGWNEQHQFYSIPYQISSWNEFYQISLDFIDDNVFFINSNGTSIIDFIIYIKVRVSFGGYTIRTIQYLFNISLILPIMKKYFSNSSTVDFYN